MLIRLLVLATLLVLIGRVFRLLVRIRPLKKQESAPPSLVQDPVCGLYIEPQTAQESIEQEGQRIYFCSSSCAQQFRARGGTLTAGSSDRTKG